MVLLGVPGEPVDAYDLKKVFIGNLPNDDSVDTVRVGRFIQAVTGMMPDELHFPPRGQRADKPKIAFAVFGIGMVK